MSKAFLTLVLVVLTQFWHLAIAAEFASKIAGVEIKSNSSVEIDFNKPRLGTVVLFFSSSCPCSISHIGVIKNLAKEYTDFQFVGVFSNTDESAEAAKKVFSELEFPLLLDPEGKLADQFAALKTPHVFVVSPKLETLFQGGVTDASDATHSKRQYLKEALIDIKNGEKPKVQVARALGCYIKRP